MSNKNVESAYTLIELVAVVLLIAVLSTFFVSRFGFNSSWSVDSSLRELKNKIDFVIQDSNSRRISYHVEFNLSENSYIIWEISPLDANDVTQVDTLAGLRSRSQQQRRRERDEVNAFNSFEEEFTRAILRDARPLDELLYTYIFDDPFSEQRRIPSLEYPAISEKVFLPPEVRLKDVLINNQSAPMHFTPDTRVITINPTLQFLLIEIHLNTDKGIAVVSSDTLNNKSIISFQ